MIYIPVTSLNVYRNFALEYYLMTEKKFTEPVLMLWATTPTVMLGKYQDATTELNLGYIREHQINVVRRYSGGGTIYTDEGGCQFTLIYPDTDATIDFSAGLQLIKAALNEIGIQATTDSRNDLVVDGLKVSGSAQYVTPGYKLHHGSLLFDSNLTAMSNALNADPVKLKAKHIASVHQRTINLVEQKPEWTPWQFRGQLIRALLNATTYKTYQLTKRDKKKIAEISATRFEDPQVIYGREASFKSVAKRYFEGGGLVRLDYTVEQQRLAAIKLTGDFFSNLDKPSFEKALRGTKFEREAIQSVIEKQLQRTPIVGVGANALASLFFGN